MEAMLVHVPLLVKSCKIEAYILWEGKNLHLGLQFLRREESSSRPRVFEKGGILIVASSFWEGRNPHRGLEFLSREESSSWPPVLISYHRNVIFKIGIVPLYWFELFSQVSEVAPWSSLYIYFWVGFVYCTWVFHSWICLDHWFVQTCAWHSWICIDLCTAFMDLFRPVHGTHGFV